MQAAAAQAPPPPPGQDMLEPQTAAAALAETLAATPPATMAQTAAAMAVSPPMGAIPSPDLFDCILVDHGNTLTLLSHFFQAAHAGDAVVMDMVAGALALDMRFHSQAENLVLYPILQTRLGEAGTQWAARALAEHGMIEQSIADIMSLRAAGGGEALINRMKQMQTEFVTHTAEEEGQILPAVAAVLSAEESIALAAQFKAAKQTAPLAPQPAATMAQAAQALSSAQQQAGLAPVAVGEGPNTVTTGVPGEGGMDVGGVTGGAGDVPASPAGGEIDMGSGGASAEELSGMEPPPAGSKAVEAGVSGMGMEAEA